MNSSGSSTQLPEWTFSYGDRARLSSISNGLGGGQDVFYESAPWYELNAPGPYKATRFARLDTQEPIWKGISGTVVATNYPYETATITPGTNGFAYLRKLEFIRFGGMYSLWAKPTSGDTLEVGFDYGSGKQSVQVTDAAIGGGLGVAIPETAQYVHPFIRCKVAANGQYCTVAGYLLSLLPSAKRVTRTSAVDQVASQPAMDRSYYYDEPATNDEVHSAVFATPPPAGSKLIRQEYSEMRGNAVVTSMGAAAQDGKRPWAKEWYAQGDRDKGTQIGAASGSFSYYEGFSTSNPADYSTKWTFTGFGTNQSFERLNGELALKTTNPAANWNVYTYRPESAVLPNRSAMLFQFRLNGLGSGAALALGGQTVSASRRWAIYIGTDNKLKFQYYNGTTFSTYTPTPEYTAVNDRWYQGMLVFDNAKLYGAVWERANPGSFTFYELPNPNLTTEAFRFIEWAYKGTIWLDDYSEGEIASLDLHQAANLSVTSAAFPSGYLDLSTYWTAVLTSTARTFVGGNRTEDRTFTAYDSSRQGGYQYGNVTSVVESYWDGSTAGYKDRRVKEMLYYPNVTPYLVGMQAFEGVFTCGAADRDGACKSLANSVLGGLTAYIYDSNTNYYTAPSFGELRGKRVLAKTDGVTNYYMDEKYEYDSYGNRDKLTKFKAYGTESTLAWSLGAPQAEVSYTCYGVDNLDGNCATDTAKYYTYPTQVINHLGHRTAFGYDLNVGKPNLAAVDVGVSGGVTTTAIWQASYDEVGRGLKLAAPGDSLTSPTVENAYTDSSSGYWVQTTRKAGGTGSAAAYVNRKYYDGLLRDWKDMTMDAVVGGVSGIEISVKKAYDANGRLVSTSVPYNDAIPTSPLTVTQTGYDYLGRTLVVTGTDGMAKELYAYGFLTATITNTVKAYKVTTSDRLGRVVNVKNFNRNHNEMQPDADYGYDFMERMNSATVGSSTSSWVFNYAGQKASSSDPDLGAWTYVYDGVGNLTQTTDARGCVITRSYDNLNRVTGRVSSGTGCGTSVSDTYTYDSTSGGNYGIGRRTSMTSNGSVNASWAYDQRGLVIKETRSPGAGSFVTQWTYNSADQATSIRYPQNNQSGTVGELVGYTYLPQGKVGAIGAYAPSVQYDAAGRLTKYTRGDGKTVTQSYYGWTEPNKPGLLSRYQVSSSLYDVTYDYDSAGNVLSVRDGSFSADYNYDDLGRLTVADTQASSNNGYDYRLLYSFDSDGRLSTVTQAAPIAYTRTYTYHATRKHAVTAVSGGWLFSYDANGNMTSRNVGTAQTLVYDAVNRLTSITAPSAVNYLYDGDDQRVKESYSTSDTRYYIGSDFEYHISGTMTISRTYIRLGSELIAMRVLGDTSLNSGYFYFKTNNLGSLTGTTKNGVIVGSNVYYPYGSPLSTNSDPNNKSEFRFTGQRMDTKNKIDVSPIGLYFYGSRYFDPLLGRFVSPDTIIPEASQGIQAWDRYAGMNNNPVRWNDPTGHDVGCAGREASDCRCNENLVPGARPPYRSTPTPTPRLEPWEFEPPLPTSIPSFPSIRAPEPGEISVPNIIESPNAQSTTGDYILIFGAGGSAGGFSSYHVSGGEFVIFPTNHSYGLYKYLGTGTISGASINVSLYMGLGINVPNPESYSGSTNSIGITFSLQEVGITVAGFMGENSSSGYVPIGLILGYSPGAGLGCFGTNAMYKLLYSK